MESKKGFGKLLFMNESFSDVTIRVVNEGVTWRFPAHRLILRSGSIPLGKMLDDSEDELIIEDLKPQVALTLLRYLYLGDVPPLKPKESLMVLYAANKYQIHGLADHYESAIRDNISLSNVCSMLERSKSLKMVAMSNFCEQFIKRYAQLILYSDNFLELSRENLSQILAADDLNIVEEGVVFDALWKWGRKQCCRTGRDLSDQSVADILGNLVFLIRYIDIKRENIVPQIITERLKRSCGANKISKPRQRYGQPAELLDHSHHVSLQGIRSWEGLRKATDLRVLCIMISVNHSAHLAAIQADIVEHNARENIVLLTVTREDTGEEVKRQEVNWADSYERNSSSGSELWLLCDTRLAPPVHLIPGIIYSIHLITIGLPGEAFPWQDVKERNCRVSSGVTLTLHSPQLLAIRKLFLVSMDNNWD